MTARVEEAEQREAGRLTDRERLRAKSSEPPSQTHTFRSVIPYQARLSAARRRRSWSGVGERLSHAKPPRERLDPTR